MESITRLIPSRRIEFSRIPYDMELLIAIALAGNILQFLEFGIKATSKAHELHSSASGTLEENLLLEYLSEHVSEVVKKLGTSSGHPGLDDIYERCLDSTTQLQDELEGLKVRG